MFAIIRTGGKQYKVQAQDVLKIEKLDVTKGQTVVFDQVLLLGDGTKAQVGTPVVEGASVHAAVINHQKADKIIVFKKKRRHNYRRKKGHRQLETVVKIVGVYEKGAKPSKADLDKVLVASKPTKEKAKEETTKKAAPAKKADSKKNTKTKEETKKAPSKKAAQKKTVKKAAEK